MKCPRTKENLILILTVASGKSHFWTCFFSCSIREPSASGFSLVLFLPKMGSLGQFFKLGVVTHSLVAHKNLFL